MRLQHPYADMTKDVPDKQADAWLAAGWVKAPTAATEEKETAPATRRRATKKGQD
ncbi:MAG: hypothetical protein J2O47_02955 [Acidimicrobiaceae bacterium]|nr:hypothetical protein [Acidimicrobiaceae bacterium]